MSVQNFIFGTKEQQMTAQKHQLIQMPKVQDAAITNLA